MKILKKDILYLIFFFYYLFRKLEEIDQQRQNFFALFAYIRFSDIKNFKSKNNGYFKRCKIRI